MDFIDPLLIIDSSVENMIGFKMVTRVKMFDLVPKHFASNILFHFKYNTANLSLDICLQLLYFGKS